MEEAKTYLGASSIHLYCENYRFQPNTPLKIFKRDEICEQITWIDIRGCCGILDSTTFKNLPNLKLISLDKCDIESIKEDTFSTIQNLNSVNARKSSFPLDENTFKACEKIDNLRFIQVKIIGSLIFKNLKNLEYLMIDHTAGVRLDKDTFLGLDNLTYLFIQNCDIEEFAEDTFESLKNLETFYFNGNTLEQFNSKAFLSLANLKVFGLYNNTITSSENQLIDYQLFENLSNLDTINFPEENLRALNFEGFKNLKHVQLITEQSKGDIVEFLEQKNVDVQWTSNSDLTEDVDFTDPNIQICA